MRNISPTQAMARQARRLLVVGMLLALFGLVILAAWFLLVVVPLSSAGWYEFLKGAALVSGLAILLVAGVLILRGLRFPRDNPYALRMAEYLARFLDYRYTFIRNIGRRGLGYVDAVLVGPPGVLVFYFFRRTGAYYSERNLWFADSGGKLQPISENPTQEAARDVNALRVFLAERGITNVPVYAVIVVVDPDTAVTVRQPVIPVAHMPNVQAALHDNYLAADRIPPDRAVATVRAIMEGLA